MPKYTCEKCGKEFNQKSPYTTHANRKTPCVIDNAVQEKLIENKLEKIHIPKPILKWLGGKTQIMDKLNF